MRFPRRRAVCRHVQRGHLVRRSVPIVLVSLSIVSTSLFGASVLFPKPLHLTREIVDPISGTTAHVEQYCLANRVVSIVGARTVIADYDRSELTEIDRQRGTYSVTPFASVAAAHPHRNSARRPVAGSAAPSVEHHGSDRRAGRSVDLYVADDASQNLHAEVAVDANAMLSRDAFDVLAGAAFPNDGNASTDITRAASRRPTSGTAATGTAMNESYGLPIEQTLRWNLGGTTISTVNRVTRVGDEVAPPDMLAIPPGALKVDSMIVRTPREAEQLDTLPGKAHP